ncbi:MAG: rhamnogalacturonan acetylesterase [Pseudomonadota bacterium]
MFRLALLATLCASAATVLAAPSLPPRIILVGDSTMATRTGYGEALCARFEPGVACLNLARGGRSTGSYRAEGLWDKVQEQLRDSGAYSATYVLIQFGHNDQPGKPGRSTDLVTQYPANLARYVSETRALGAVPILVTPLTRRSFRGAWLHDDLAPWSATVRSIARQHQVDLLDLNKFSMAAVQAMGTAQADTLAQDPPPKDAMIDGRKSAFDYTHVGPKGAELFSGLVVKDLVRLRPALAASLRQQ